MGAASNFEFKFRFWIIGAVFWLAFASYALDHQNAGAALVDYIAHLRGTTPSDVGYHALFAVAGLICLAAAALRTWATAYLNPEVMTDMRLHTSRLVADGPYRYVRNPLYLGNIVLAFGFGAMASRTGFFILVLGMLFICYRLILREEAGILATQGESYRAYCAAVPRLWPSLRPRLPSAGSTPDWAGGFLGEAFMWALALSIVGFAISLKQGVFFAVLGSAFAVYAICYMFISKRRKMTTASAQPSTAERPPEGSGQSNSD